MLGERMQNRSKYPAIRAGESPAEAAFRARLEQAAEEATAKLRPPKIRQMVAEVYRLLLGRGKSNV